MHISPYRSMIISCARIRIVQTQSHVASLGQTESPRSPLAVVPPHISQPTSRCSSFTYSFLRVYQWLCGTFRKTRNNRVHHLPQTSSPGTPRQEHIDFVTEVSRQCASVNTEINEFWLLVEVEDTGIGLNASAKNRIFDPCMFSELILNHSSIYISARSLLIEPAA